MAYINTYDFLELFAVASTGQDKQFINTVKMVLEDTPAADVAGVKGSNWELKSRVYKMLDDVDEEFYVECPLCHRTEYVPFELEEEKMLEYARKHYPYCHCGAKMDGKDGE